MAPSLRVRELVALLLQQDQEALVGNTLSDVNGSVAEIVGLVRAPDGTIGIDAGDSTLFDGEEQDLEPVLPQEPAPAEDLRIWTPRSLAPSGRSCCKFQVGSRELSIAMDDSCGAMQECSRASIRLYDGDRDVTREVFDPEYIPTVLPEDFERAYAWLKTGK